MGLENPGITVVVPTHNRYHKLRALLESLSDYKTDAIRSVIVVDDSTRPEDISKEFQGLELNQVVLKTRCFISRSKNIGWRLAETEFVYFIDDDNVVDRSTLGPVLEIMVRRPSAGAIMPSVLYKSRPDLVWVYATPMTGNRFKHNLVGRNLPRNPSLENRLVKTDALPNASMIRRAALKDVGGFDETLVVNSSADISLRLRSKGWEVLAYTGSFIYHDVEPPGELGWWAAHGVADPGRVRYEIRDWFVLTRRMRGRDRLFKLRAIIESSKFVLPNLLAYLVRGRERVTLLRSLAAGYLEGLRLRQDEIAY